MKWGKLLVKQGAKPKQVTSMSTKTARLVSKKVVQCTMMAYPCKYCAYLSILNYLHWICNIKLFAFISIFFNIIFYTVMYVSSKFNFSLVWASTMMLESSVSLLELKKLVWWQTLTSSWSLGEMKWVTVWLFLYLYFIFSRVLFMSMNLIF